MEERRNPMNQDNPEEKAAPAEPEEQAQGAAPEEWEEPETEGEYSFMQEVIKDEAGGGRKFQRDVRRMIILGLILGLAACVGFCAFRPWIERQFGTGQEEIRIPRDEEETPQEEEPETEEGQDPEKASYRQMLNALRSISEQARKSVATIAVTSSKSEEERTRQISGVIVADNGKELLILGQVLPRGENDSLEAVFADERSYKASVKRQDSNLGLCVYAVPRSDIVSDTWGAIRIAVLGSSHSVEEGDAAILMGRPFGYAQAGMYGLVSASETYAEYADGHYRLISTDIEGDENNSGVLVNTSGEVVGVAGRSQESQADTGLVEVYGISDIKEIIELLSNGDGVPYLGILGADVTEELEEQGLPKGAYVDEVEADSPAMEAGIQSGDVITEMDGVGINGFQAYHNALMKKKEGSTLTILCQRQGAGGEYVDISFQVKVGTRE